MTSSTKQWGFSIALATAWGASLSGCQLGVEQLEAGDEDDESGGPGETGAEASNACVVQGTNLGGGSEALDYPLPECEVACATGWGHDAAPLAIAWTLDLEHAGPTTGFTHLGLLPSGDLLALIGQSDAPARMVFVSPTGELLDELTQPAITGELWDLGIDASGTIYALWRDGGSQSLSAMSSGGEHLWTVELGPHQVYASTLAALSSGVVVALNPADEFGTSELLRVSPSGQITPRGSIPLTWEVAVSPSGNTVALANITEITWVDFELFPGSMPMQGVADVYAVLGLVALDDERVASVGAAKNWDEGGSLQGFVKQIGPMGVDWEARYNRALAWCLDEDAGYATPTDEVFVDLARLADGSLLIVGGESAGPGPSAGQTGSEQVQQPWVGHVSAEGAVLATDRGFWRGQAVAAVGASDGSAYALMSEFDADGQQHLHLRKYLP